MNKQIGLEELKTLLEATTQEGLEFTITVSGSSMMPLFVDGVTKVILGRPDNLRLGDVVLFSTKEGKILLHRIVQIEPSTNTFTMRGDALVRSDEPVVQNNILAKVLGYFNENRYILMESKEQKRIWAKQKRFFSIRKGIVRLKRLVKRLFGR